MSGSPNLTWTTKIDNTARVLLSLFCGAFIVIVSVFGHRLVVPLVVVWCLWLLFGGAFGCCLVFGGAFGHSLVKAFGRRLLVLFIVVVGA
ncbi:hypothetical protein C2G38_2156330 [Gigaspora rosea]|uniref:Uncharacterized protein n=1 Tax=Gigaspora rosea TaxID=44941 RepID=A0A397WB99_9GLOM|nr:hypothetical protein C2G38_2156330 [Gigaspora rosea]